MYEYAATQKLQPWKDGSLMLWMHLGAEPESSHMLYIFGSCDVWIAPSFKKKKAWIALDQPYMKLWCDQFSNGQMGFFDRIGHAFSTAPWIDPSVLGITHHCPCHYTPPGTSHSSCHKEDPLHVCLLSFAWLYMDSMDMLFRGPWGAFYFLSSFCTSVDPTCYYLYSCSMAKWLLQRFWCHFHFYSCC